MSGAFPTLHLSATEVQDYEALRARILKEHMSEYHKFVHQQNRIMNKSKWRITKTRDNLTAYRRLTSDESLAASHKSSTASTPSYSSSSSASDSGSGSRCSTASEELTAAIESPKMAVVGTIVGSLEDALYGTLAPDVASMKVKTAYLDDEYVDWRVIATMKTPSPAHPFEFMGIKCAVKTIPHASVIMRAREFLYLDATGITTTDDGERIGFHIFHSIDLPHYFTRATTEVVRAKLANCYLLRQMPNHTVDVYARAWFEAGGKVMERMATMRATHTLLGTWKWMWCAHNRKLAYLVRTTPGAKERQMVDYMNRATNEARATKEQCCALCAKSMSMFRSLLYCVLCERPACSKCRVSRKLASVLQSGEGLSIPTTFCMGCVSRASQLDTAQVSLHDHTEGETSTASGIASSSVASSLSASTKARARSGHFDRRGADGTGGNDRPGLPTSLSMDQLIRTDSKNQYLYQYQYQGQDQQATPSSSGSAQGDPAQTFFVNDQVVTTSIVPMGQPVPTPKTDYLRYTQMHEQMQGQMQARPVAAIPVNDQGHKEAHDAQLWMQMQKLRLAAEETYAITRQNADAMKHESEPYRII